VDASAIIALSALLLSALTFAATQIGTRRSASETYVRELEGRIEALERELGVTRIRNTELEAENLRLMRIVLKEA
jgi:hypothetical protein